MDSNTIEKVKNLLSKIEARGCTAAETAGARRAATNILKRYNMTIAQFTSTHGTTESYTRARSYTSSSYGAGAYSAQQRAYYEYRKRVYKLKDLEERLRRMVEEDNYRARQREQRLKKGFSDAMNICIIITFWIFIIIVYNASH